jgi:NCAIR mutase (PurE)-related protein
VNKDHLKNILTGVKNGEIAIDEALHRLRSLPYDDLDFARLDTHRELRTGFSEVIFCRGKTVEHITEIVDRLAAKTGPILATKAEREVYDAIRAQHDDAVYHEQAKIVVIGKAREKIHDRPIVIVCAGTADLPVVEEAAVTAEAMGNVVERLHDVGVAGMHRILDEREKLFAAGVIIVVAGMEGALASVVGGLVDRPVIAVPTSVGYGASFDGLAALLTMLNCCAPGVTVVNIDNGFGAGYYASMINRMADKV